MNRSTYALKLHLTTFPSGIDGEQQSLSGFRRHQTKNSLQNIWRKLLAASGFKGIKVVPVVFVQTYTHMHAHMHIHGYQNENLYILKCNWEFENLHEKQLFGSLGWGWGVRSSHSLVYRLILVTVCMSFLAKCKHLQSFPMPSEILLC